MSKKPIKKSDKSKPWYRQRIKMQPYDTEKSERNKVFLIICEGQNTEPEYFKSFPVVTATVESYGTGTSRLKLVEQVIEIKKSEEGEKEIWVVFDMDIQRDNAAQLKADFDGAINLARQHEIKVAYANDAFELWFLLHYMYFENQWTRREYYQKLSNLWDLNYEKSGKSLVFCKRIYQRLMNDENADQNTAIRNARTLLEKQSTLKFSEQNPCTTIFKLVEELNNYI